MAGRVSGHYAPHMLASKTRDEASADLRMWRSAIVVLLSLSPFAAAEDPWVRFSGDGSRIVVERAGITEFGGVSRAVFVEGDNNNVVGNRSHALNGAVRFSERATPFGKAMVSEATYGEPGAEFQYTLILKRLIEIDAFTIQAVFHNRSERDVRLRAFDLLDARKNSGGAFRVPDSDAWLVTPLMEDAPAVSLTLAEKRLKEAALLYDKDGHGFLVGPVGPAEAYTSFQAVGKEFIAGVEMDGVLVRAGESRRSEEMIFAFEPVEAATKIWTRWVAATHGARLHRGPVYGWCSWYDRTTNIDETHITEVTRTIGENPDVFGKGIIQIDDGYQKMDGDWSANEKFPSGMQAAAKRIRAIGCTPGVWFAPLMMHPDHPWQKEHPDAMQKNAQGISSFSNPNPFHPAGANWINPSHPESRKFLSNIIGDAVKQGFGYIKIDFNGIGNQFVDPTKTRLQAFRELYALYREAAGEETYILSCLGSPTRGVVGFIDSARVGPDSHPGGFPHCLDSVLRFQIFHGEWWQNDADVSYLAKKLESRKVGHTSQGEGMWKSWHGIVALTGGTAMISEPIQMPDVKEVWRNHEIMRPPGPEKSRLLGLGKSAENQAFGFVASRPYGDFAVFNLYNPGSQAKPIELDLTAAGLPAGVKCAVFDFWSNELLGYATGSYSTGPLEPLSSRLLRFTPIVDPNVDLPVLVGSDLHLTMGAAEVADVRAAPSELTVELKAGGARKGSLTFLSNRTLSAKSSENCKLDSVEKIGENLWRIHLSGRKWDSPQSFVLGIGPVPNVSQQ